MIFIVVLILVVALAVAFVVAVAKDQGPQPIEIALAYEHAWDLLDFDVIYRLSGQELHDGLNKAQYIERKKAAYSNGSGLRNLVEHTTAESEIHQGDAATVVTHLTLRDGSEVRHEVRLLRRSRVGGRRLRPPTRVRRLTPTPAAAVPIPGLLLTGGRSSRMGTAKATLLVDGEPLAERSAHLLAEVCDPVLEVGPGYSQLATVAEPDPGQGPLAALVAGAAAVGPGTAVLLLACDLPFVTRELLSRLANAPGTGTVVPVDEHGMVQPVCARYSAAACARAGELLAAGERSLRRLLDETAVTELADLDDRALVDVDTPDDATRWGIRRPGSLDP